MLFHTCIDFREFVGEIFLRKVVKVGVLIVLTKDIFLVIIVDDGFTVVIVSRVRYFQLPHSGFAPPGLG